MGRSLAFSSQFAVVKSLVAVHYTAVLKMAGGRWKRTALEGDTDALFAMIKVIDISVACYCLANTCAPVSCTPTR